MEENRLLITNPGLHYTLDCHAGACAGDLIQTLLPDARCYGRTRHSVVGKFRNDCWIDPGSEVLCPIIVVRV